AKKAVEMGNGAYTKGLKQCGFGYDLTYKYPITKSSISSNGKIENEVLLANTSYGQGEVEISALHMALTYTPILNKGDMLKPTLLLSEKTSKVWQEKLINRSEEHTSELQS